ACQGGSQGVISTPPDLLDFAGAGQAYAAAMHSAKLSPNSRHWSRCNSAADFKAASLCQLAHLSEALAKSEELVRLGIEMTADFFCFKGRVRRGVRHTEQELGALRSDRSPSTIIFERRILLSCTILVGVSICIWSVAIGTDHWFALESPDENGVPLGGASSAKRLLYKHAGLWKSCITGLTSEFENSTNLVRYSECKYLNMFPTEIQVKLDSSLNTTMLTDWRPDSVRFSVDKLDLKETGPEKSDGADSNSGPPVCSPRTQTARLLGRCVE
ncbi:uncharacterized protein LOC109860904, partial [Pseudomyrmex gracilis]|uniref:uncharacterized protein LOC109860904 n=1 Tax=Pseudomyrmex gracilis TaxID=219809 RepID=UPI0009954832